MKFFNNMFPVLGLFAISGCATINNPEGGPQDKTPPTLLSSTPADQELNVTTNTITLDFDEEIQQNNLNRELQITPNLDNKFRVRTDENQLQIIFEEPLQNSTTYILNFGEGIQDITEKNTAEGLKLAFSTGSYIDSSRVSGTVVHMLTNEPLNEGIVALYPAMDTLSIRKNKPYYQAKTNAAGEYSFTNVKEGAYRIYALQDLNNNSIYDNENEAVAYKQEPILVTPQEQQVTLQLVKIDTKKPILIKRDRFADRLAGTYSEGIENISIGRAGNSNDTLTYKMRTDGRTVDLFKTQKFEGGNVIFSAADSSGNSSIDTVQVAFGQNFPQIIAGAQFKVTNNRNNTTYSPGQLIIVELQTPVSITGTTPVSIASDSATSVALNFPEQVTVDPTGTELSFAVPKLNARAEPYTIELDSTQIIPLTGPRLRLPDLQFQIAEGTGTGSVSGSINTSNESFIIQLLNSENRVVAETRNMKSFTFRNREPGDYRIRVVIDENNNGEWDGPDAAFTREPEKVYFSTQPITIRADWEIEDINVEIKE